MASISTRAPLGRAPTWKQERADNYLYSEVSYYTSPYVIGVASDNTTINSLDDLAGMHGSKAVARFCLRELENRLRLAGQTVKNNFVKNFSFLRQIY